MCLVSGEHVYNTVIMKLLVKQASLLPVSISVSVCAHACVPVIMYTGAHGAFKIALYAVRSEHGAIDKATGRRAA